MSLKHLSCPSKILAASITAAASSFKLNNIEGWDGVDLTSADFGSQAFAVIRNANNTILELIEFDPATIADASITILKRGLKFTGDLTTEVTANKLAWTKGDTFIDIGVDTPQMYQWLQEYVDAAIVAGGVPATTSVLGLAKASVAPASAASPIFVGDNDPRVPTQGENDAAAGGGFLGTPSTSNKFITETGATPTVQTFLSSGTYTKPTGVKFIFVQAWGGGGSGASYTGQNAAGGGGAGYFERWIQASDVAATETVTIGNGGAAVSGATAGNPGQNTTFGSLVTAYGGSGGTSGVGNTTGGNGGDIQSGSTLFRGLGASAVGGVGILWGGAAGGGVTDATTGHAGGAALYGGGGGGGSCVETAASYGAGGASVYGGAGGAAHATAGVAGSVPGGGGGGAGNGTSGAGGKGKIIVTEYYS